MRSVILGLIVGAVLSFAVSCFYLYSFSFLLLGLSTLIAGFSSFQKESLKIPLCTSFAFFVSYVAIFWVSPEIQSKLAYSADEHFSAGMAMATRAQIFADNKRAVDHYKQAANKGHQGSIQILADAYRHGHYDLPKNLEESARYSQRLHVNE